MKIVFLDRDGVINEFPGNGNYVTTVDAFHFIPGSLDAIKALTDNGYTIFVVSNQAGVGKGIFSNDTLQAITDKMLQAVKAHGGHIEKVFYSTARSDAGCPDRKPNIGSIHKALKHLRSSDEVLKTSYFVGDTQSDIQAGINAGCRTIFVLSGRESVPYLRKRWCIRPDFIADRLSEAADIIIDHENLPYHRPSYSNP